MFVGRYNIKFKISILLFSVILLLLISAEWNFLPAAAGFVFLCNVGSVVIVLLFCPKDDCPSSLGVWYGKFCSIAIATMFFVSIYQLFEYFTLVETIILLVAIVIFSILSNYFARSIFMTFVSKYKGE